MATTDTTTGTISADMRWVLNSLRAAETIQSSGNITFKQEFASGTGANPGEWKTVYVDEITIAGSGSLSLELDGLTLSVADYYSKEWGIQFASLRGILIINMETILGRDLRLSSTGASHYAQIFDDSTTSEILIPAGGAMAWSAPDETTFGGTATDMQLNVPGANDVTFQLYLGGI